MKKWEHILYRPPFLVCTNASSLKYIVNLKSEQTIFQHLYAELAQFEFIVIHKKESEMNYHVQNILMSLQLWSMKNAKKIMK